MIGISLALGAATATAPEPGPPVLLAVAVDPAGGPVGTAFHARVARAGPAAALAYEWRLDDVPAGEGPTHVAAAAGALAVRVTATNAAGEARLLSAPVPVAAAAPVVLSGGFDGAAFDEAGSTADADVIAIRARPLAPTEAITSQARQVLVRVDGVMGRRPEVRLHRPFQNGTSSTRWNLCWGPDLDGGDWRRFDATFTGTGTVVWGRNDAPFGVDTIYVSLMPVFSNGRWRRRTDAWVAHPLTRPTASGNAACEIGTLPATVEGHYGRDVPAFVQRAFAVGTGPHAVVLTGNVHTDEHIGAYAFEGAVCWLLSEEPAAAAFRAMATTYVYPGLNPQGRFMGYSRSTIETAPPVDANRQWIAGAGGSHAAFYQARWAADLPPAIDVALDFHHAPTRTEAALVYWYPDLLSPARREALGAALDAVAAASATGPVLWVESESPDTIGRTMGTVFGAKVPVVIEYGQTLERGPADWRRWGAEVLRAVWESRFRTFAALGVPSPELTGASVSWEPVPGAGGYDLRHAREGEEWTLVAGAASPYPLPGSSGHVVQVRATGGGETGAWSAPLAQPSGGTWYQTVFSASGSFAVPTGVTSLRHVLVQSGGGGGGSRLGGGGGGGGATLLLENVPVAPGSQIAITIGRGGAGGSAAEGELGQNGGSSVFGEHSAAGGGGGGSAQGTVSPLSNGLAGGNGGGAGRGSAANRQGGAGLAGFAGGDSTSNNAGGGGGSGEPGADALQSGGFNHAGRGGDGRDLRAVFGSAVGEDGWFGGGGGGGYLCSTLGNGAWGAGGRGGGGKGGGGDPASPDVAVRAGDGAPGRDGTGGGGGGATGGGGNNRAGGRGGDGCVVLRWSR